VADEPTGVHPDNIAADALAADRRAVAVRLRARGATWPEVARTAGYDSPAAAFRDVGAAMAESTMRAETTADQHRDEAHLRLEYLLSEAMDIIGTETMTDLDGNPVGTDGRVISLRAIDESRRLVESIAKLNGVATPAKEDTSAGPMRIEIVGIDPTDII
jgi:hypothetical protein